MKKYTIKTVTAIGIAIMSLITSSGFSQIPKNKIRDLAIGDTIPNILIKGMLNRHEVSRPVSSYYKSGLLIINFWATWCVPCIRELPKLDSLKQKFGDKLNVVSVEYEDSAIVKKFFVKHPDTHVNNLVITTNDTLLVQYFKHRYLPHNIWIDKAGIVRAITGEDEIESDKIATFLKGDRQDLAVKKDNLEFDYRQPFHLGDSSFTYRSISTHYVNGLPSGNIYAGTKDNELNRFFSFNQSILDLFWFVYTKSVRYYKKDYRLIQVHTQDSAKFFTPDLIISKQNNYQPAQMTNWVKGNTFCYELTLPRNVAYDTFFNYLITDFERIFNLKYRTGTKKLLCDVVTLQAGSKFKLTDYKAKEDTLSYVNFFKDKLTIKNANIGTMINQILSSWNIKEDLWIDDTKLDFPIDLVITFDTSKPITLEVIKAELTNYGLVFTKKQRDYPIMIIDDLN